MPIGFMVWFAAAGGIGLFWIVRLIAVELAIRKRVVLHDRSYDGPPTDAPKVSVVLAAKDEQDNIETCVTSLLDQDYPDFELIVIDDRSTDRTPAILAELKARAADRLKVLTVTELPDGWFGKSNAVHQGVAAASGDWLLFTDADCRFVSPSTISMAMRESLARDVDFLSITPTLETLALWERIIQPVCALVLIVWFLPQRVNNPASRTAYANGAFMLVRRACYDTIGGHERVRSAVNEDVQMARFAKRMGFTLRVVENKDLYLTRMYDTFTAAFRGWGRIFYGCISTMRRLSTAVALLVLLSILPWACLVAAVVGAAFAEGAAFVWWRYSIGAWLLATALLQLSMWRVYPMMRMHPAWSFTYILGVFVALGALVSAMFQSLGLMGTTWRGTTYRIGSPVLSEPGSGQNRLLRRSNGGRAALRSAGKPVPHVTPPPLTSRTPGPSAKGEEPASHV